MTRPKGRTQRHIIVIRHRDFYVRKKQTCRRENYKICLICSFQLTFHGPASQPNAVFGPQAVQCLCLEKFTSCKCIEPMPLQLYLLFCYCELFKVNIFHACHYIHSEKEEHSIKTSKVHSEIQKSEEPPLPSKTNCLLYSMLRKVSSKILLLNKALRGI